MQAVILGGGKGERLGAIAAGRAKPLIEVGGKPFVRYLIDNLRRFGFDDIVMLAGPFAEAYRDCFGDTVTIVPESPPAGTGGALVHAGPYLRATFLLLNGDSYFDFNWLDLAARPLGRRSLARLALREVPDCGRFGAVTMTDERIVRFAEKSTSEAGLINAGIYWMRHDIVDELGPSPVSLEREVLPRLAARGALLGTAYAGSFIDIGVPDELARAARVMPQWERRPAAFLDRDGVINLDTGYVHRQRDFVWREGAAGAIKRLNDAGFFVFVVTNQSGIARGLYGLRDVERLHRWINRELSRTGAHVDEFYFCPHHPDGIGRYRTVCECRKPAPGMILQAMREWPVERERSFLVGDKDIDMEAAKAAGVHGAMIGHIDAIDEFCLRLLERHSVGHDDRPPHSAIL